MAGLRGEEYQRRFDRLAESGAYLHGEADLVSSFGPARVLDAGCGTGRVAIELRRRGIEVVGVDVDDTMLEVARRLDPAVEWVRADLSSDRLPGGPFDMVVAAGNVLLFTAPGTEESLVANVASVVAPGGRLVAGFQLGDRPWDLSDYDRWAQGAGLGLEARWSTWERGGWAPGAGYAVSVHRRPGP